MRHIFTNLPSDNDVHAHHKQIIWDLHIYKSKSHHDIHHIPYTKYVRSIGPIFTNLKSDDHDMIRVYWMGVLTMEQKNVNA